MKGQRKYKYVSIAAGSRAYSNGQQSNLDEFLAEAKRRGEKVLDFKRVGNNWDVKLMVRA